MFGLGPLLLPALLRGVLVSFRRRSEIVRRDIAGGVAGVVDRGGGDGVVPHGTVGARRWARADAGEQLGRRAGDGARADGGLGGEFGPADDERVGVARADAGAPAEVGEFGEGLAGAQPVRCVGGGVVFAGETFRVGLLEGVCCVKPSQVILTGRSTVDALADPRSPRAGGPSDARDGLPGPLRP
jgi:hypothetical protein